MRLLNKLKKFWAEKLSMLSNMEYPFALSLIFLCLSVVLLAQAAITIYTYNKEKRAQDLNYYWSILVLVGAIIGTIASLAGMFMNRKSAQAVIASTVGSTGIPSSATLGAQLEAVANLEKAQVEAAKVLKAA